MSTEDEFDIVYLHRALSEVCEWNWFDEDCWSDDDELDDMTNNLNIHMSKLLDELHSI